ncbi:MAG: alpha/beta hydrolase [Candidatus Peribacteraceae bacterium]|nr:alpha/beta hydrolase [Candidatus Peribacteraceae bacterium]
MTPVLLCLHGWGGSKESFEELRAALDNEDILILTPDLPGFGAEPEPDRPWSVDDYADWVEDWIQKTLRPTPYALSPLLLLGHSHGGRIAIKLASRQTTRNEQRSTINARFEHLYLCAAAGVRHRSLKRSVGRVLAGIGHALFAIPGLSRLEPYAKKMLYKILREHDYERASPVMQKTFAKVTEEDLTPILSAITIPTDLFWGEDDTYTPVKDGFTMHTAIRGSVLHTFAGTRHRVHRDRALEIASVIRNHL